MSKGKNDFFGHLYDTCRTNVGHRHVSDTATRLTIEVSLLYSRLVTQEHA
jgi:hypothetical protein